MSDVNLRPEEALLGCLLYDNTCIDQISDLLKEEDFVSPLHRNVYRAIQCLLAEGKSADVICVAEFLKNEKNSLGKDPFIELCEMINGQCVPQNARQYAEIIKHKSLDRQIILAAQDIIASVHAQKENRLDYAQKRIYEVTDQVTTQIILAADILPEVLDRMEKRQEMGGISGLPTGFDELDQLTQGLQGGDLIILAGRPAMGKTLLAMNIAEYVAFVESKTVAIFSLEMSKEQLLERSLISKAKLKASKVKSGKLDAEDFEKIGLIIPIVQNAKLYIDDQSQLGVMDIRAKCRRILRESSLSLIVVDYIGLLEGPGENETLKISNISRGLKLLARDLNVPIIAISQLNRALEGRPNKRPCMADLRQSGAIEQDADLILFIYRDEVYNEKSSYKGIAELIIGKHRSGEIGKINLFFHKESCRFENYSGPSIAHAEIENNWSGRPFTYTKDL